MRNVFLTITMVISFLYAQLWAQEEKQYTMKCYNANNDNCPCNKAKKAKKKKLHASALKNNKNKNKDKLKRARALALRNAAKENQKLKDELEALRRANLIASAKQAGTPSDAKLAENTEAQAPKIVVTREEIAPAVEEKNENQFFARVTNTVTKDYVSTEQPLVNTFAAEVGYKPIPLMKLSIKPGVAWNWTTPANTPSNGNTFEFKNTPIKFEYKEFAKFEKINSYLIGTMIAVLPTNTNDRNNGLISQLHSYLTLHTDFGNGKTDIEFTPGLVFDIRQNTTSAPSSNPSAIANEKTYTHSDGARFEILTPNTQYSVNFLTELEHQFVEMFGGSIWTKFSFNKKYSDSISYNGQSLTLVPDLWDNRIEIGAKAEVNFTKEFIGQIGLVSNGTISGYKPFGTSDNNSVTAWFQLKYKYN